jgi:hypothetical protein
MAMIEQLAATLQGLAGPGTKRMELIATESQKHTDAVDPTGHLQRKAGPAVPLTGSG